MTICIGLIPNEKTVMLLQDSEITYGQIGFTQDIFNKIKQIDDNTITGVIGNPLIANEILDIIKTRKYKQARELKGTVEDAYHMVRDEKLLKGTLRKYGFGNIREVLQSPKEVSIDPAVREEVLATANDKNGEFRLTLMLATIIDGPQLYAIDFPGAGTLENNVKMYAVRGSGSIMAIDKMGEELERYRWQPELNVDEGIDVLLRAGKASEKHIGVGGPFEITYLTQGEDGKNKVIRPDQKKINMAMYLFPLDINKKVMKNVIEKMRDEKITSGELADYIKKSTEVGMEFDQYFKLSK